MTIRPLRESATVGRSWTAGTPAEQGEQGGGRRRRATLSTVRRRALAYGDLAAMLATITVAVIAGDPDGRAADQLPWALLIAPATLLLFKLYGLYDRDDKRIGHLSLDDVPGVFHGLVLAVLGLWLLLKVVLPEGRLVLVQAILLLPIGLTAVLGVRALVRRAVRGLAAPERVVLVGAGKEGAMLLRKLRGHPQHALVPVGYLAGDHHVALDVPLLGRPEELVQVCYEQEAERVLVASAQVAGDDLANLVRAAGAAGIKVSILPTMVDVLGPTTELDDIAGVTILGVYPSKLSKSSWWLKRTLDVVVSGAAIVFLLPLFPVLALAIKLDSPGPVLFRQERLGRRGRLFSLLKLRTMNRDAEEQVDELKALSTHPAWLLLEDDPRVTRVGRFLRQWSLDELPQLLNVLRGEMSLVGPRPMTPDVDRRIGGWGRRRLDLTPGLTGLWQVLGRTSIPFEEMIKLDYVYVTNWTAWGDIRLLLRTVLVVLSRRGAT